MAVTAAPATGRTRPAPELVFNPGGPGESGNQILPVLVARFPPSVRQSFDIVSFDPVAPAPVSRSTAAPPRRRQPARPGTDTTADPCPAHSVYAAMARPATAGSQTSFPYRHGRHRSGSRSDPAGSRGVQARLLRPVLRHGARRRLRRPVPTSGSVPSSSTARSTWSHLTTQATQEAPAAEQSLDHLLTSCSTAAACPLGHRPADVLPLAVGGTGATGTPAPGQGDDYPVTVGDLDTAALLTVSVPTFTS